MKIALVGIGEIARNQHVPSIAGSPAWELAATVSRSGTVEGVPAFTDFGRFLEECPDVGVVSLCLPPVPRFDYARQALEAGRHVMLEKPPGATLAECAALEAQARAGGLTLFASWHSREAAMVPVAKDWLAGKVLKRLAINWREDVRRWHPGQEWIWEPGGLGVFDPGINALSILTEILPDPVHLSQARLEFPANKQAPIGAELAFCHPAGAEVSAVFDWRQEGDQTWEITAETDAGQMRLWDGGARISVPGREPEGFDGDALVGEYPRLYNKMAGLVAASEIEMDIAPLRHVADAFMLGRREIVADFVE